MTGGQVHLHRGVPADDPDYRGRVTTEQRHQNSPYWFVRDHAWAPSDTLPMRGKGRTVNYTGMTWSGFRPSDDSCKFGYLIPPT